MSRHQRDRTNPPEGPRNSGPSDEEEEGEVLESLEGGIARLTRANRELQLRAERYSLLQQRREIGHNPSAGVGAGTTPISHKRYASSEHPAARV